MPIKPELRYYYPIDWPQVSRWVRFVNRHGNGTPDRCAIGALAQFW
jgi:hypothetical protein